MREGAFVCSEGVVGGRAPPPAPFGWFALTLLFIAEQYPLSATICAEGTSSNKNRATEVAKGFFWQTPGSIMPYLVAWVLVAIAGQAATGADHKGTVEMQVRGAARTSVRGGIDSNSNARRTQYRVMFGLGAVPSVLVMMLTYLQFRGDAAANKPVGNENPLRVAARHPELWRRLVGTSFTWFLYDFVYYGTALSQPEIVQNVFGDDEGL